MNIQENIRRLYAPLANYDRPYDEERFESLSSSSRRWIKIRLGIPRVRKLTLYLLLINLILVGLLVHAFEPLISLLLRNHELFGHEVSIDHRGSPEALHRPDRKKIPRILHQTCANDTIPLAWASSQQSCKEAYSDFEYKLWTDESARNFLLAEFPWYIDTWDNYPFPIQRADAIRYFVLFFYGGIYMDMDTHCNKSFPIHQIESLPGKDHALFQSTLPTGITNDFLISSARHPVFEGAISRLSGFHKGTRLWARLQPYIAIMLSTGPLFLTLAVKDYLLKQSSLPSPTIQVINPSDLLPYISDLETATWHQKDAQILKWLGDRPWTWFSLGFLGFVAGIYIFNYVLLRTFTTLHRKIFCYL